MLRCVKLRLICQYEEGDVVGLVLAVTTVSILGVFLIMCTWFAARRELYTLYFLVGTVFSEIVNVILKLLIAEQRPNRMLSFTPIVIFLH